MWGMGNLSIGECQNVFYFLKLNIAMETGPAQGDSASQMEYVASSYQENFPVLVSHESVRPCRPEAERHFQMLLL